MSAAEGENSQDALARLRIKRTQQPHRRSARKRWTTLIGAVLLFAVLAASAYLVAQRNNWIGNPDWFAVPDAIAPRTEVRVVPVTVETGRSADALVVATGYLESRRQAKIGARAPGRIQAIHVEEGSRVKSQQVLAILEHSDLDASVLAAQAVLERSKAELLEQDVEIARTKSEFDRAVNLRGSRVMTESEYDQAKFQYEAAVARRDSLRAAISLAEARVREAEQLRENMFIRASFDGTVISKDAEVGESIMPGGMGEASGRGSVVTIADLDHLEVECDVKEDYISRVSGGQPAEVAVDAVPDRRYEGRVRKVIPMGDRARATIKVKVEIVDADERLFPEMSSTVYFLPDEAQNAHSNQRRVFCPSGAVTGNGDDSFVWTVDEDDRVVQVNVGAGATRDGRTEIMRGLSGHERVIAQPPTDIRAGLLVKVVE